MKDETPFLFGAIPSERDYRSEVLANAVADLVKPTVTLPKQLVTDLSKFYVLNQHRTPACVSHAWALFLTIYWYLKTGKVIKFNPQFMHILSAWDGAGAEDGRSPITVAQVSKNYGCATVDIMPDQSASLDNATYMDKKWLTDAVMADAAKYKIPSYLLLGSTAGKITEDIIRQAIANYGAVSLLFKIGKEWWTNPNGVTSYAKADLSPLRTPAVVSGGHEVLGFGWNNQIDRLRNSWGADWCDGGDVDFILNEWQPFIYEAIVIADIPTDALKLVQGLPKAKEFKHNFAKDIKYTTRSLEVRALQIALAIDGSFAYPEITSYFGSVTADAVLAFQRKYKVADESELAPLKGRSVGPKTRQKLNELFNI